MGLALKDPGARIDYALDWGAAYLAGQTIVASTWMIDPATSDGAAIAAHSFDAARASVTLSGGTEGVSYRVTNRVTLSDGQIDERSLTLRVEQR